MRAYAAAHFEWEELLRINFPGGCQCLLQSEYTGGREGGRYPVTIYGEIRGEFSELEVAQSRLANLINGDLLPVISVATNAAVALPMPVACFGVDLTEPQPFLGYRTPPAESFFPPGRRRIQIEPLVELMEAVGTREDPAALRRANESFRHALLHWSPQERLLGGEFLYIAAETLSRFLAESRARERGMNPRALARVEGLAKVEDLRRAILVEIFDGDEDVLEGLEQASNGFEHGYMATSSARERMEPVLEDALRTVRAALIRAAGVGEETVTALLSGDYAEPRPLVPPLHILEGTLSRTDLSVPANEDLPWGVIDLRWSNLEPRTAEVDGEVAFVFRPEIEISNLPENVSLTTKRFGLQARYVTAVSAPAKGEQAARTEGDPPDERAAASE